MENLTILEAARLLGYTKNAVKYQVNKLPPEMTQKDANGVIHITPEGLEVLRGKMGDKQPDKNQQKTGNNHEKPPTTSKRTTQEPGKDFSFTGKTTTEENALYNALLQTVETLRGQLEEKDKQIEAATNEKEKLLQLLDQQQRLNAGTLAVSKTEALPEKTEPPERGGIFKIFRRSKE